MSVEWLSTRQVADKLSARRDNDVRVHIRGTNVPIVRVHYHRAADMVIMDLDENSEDYLIAFAESGDGKPPPGPEYPRAGVVRPSEDTAILDRIMRWSYQASDDDLATAMHFLSQQAARRSGRI